MWLPVLLLWTSRTSPTDRRFRTRFTCDSGRPRATPPLRRSVEPDICRRSPRLQSRFLSERTQLTSEHLRPLDLAESGLSRPRTTRYERPCEPIFGSWRFDSTQAPSEPLRAGPRFERGGQVTSVSVV
jgi:hypothetical protein